MSDVYGLGYETMPIDRFAVETVLEDDGGWVGLWKYRNRVRRQKIVSNCLDDWYLLVWIACYDELRHRRRSLKASPSVLASSAVS